jgi:hypothetical protein
MASEDGYPEQVIDAGIALTELLANPSSWINRRVETIELLSREETRRRVSIDFTLAPEKASELDTEHGLVVPISVLTKEPRRNFDICDESGAAIPVLGKNSNAALAHVAVMNAALDVLPEDLDAEAFELLWSELRQVVTGEPGQADEALNVFVGNAEADGGLRGAIWEDETCRSLLSVLRHNYVLFAALEKGGPRRRVLKYSYGDDFEFEIEGTFKERYAPWLVWQRLIRPDRSRFVLLCPEAWRAESFHVEIAIPEDLRIEGAVLWDFENEQPVSAVDSDKNRASLYPETPLEPEASADAFVIVAPERRGRTIQAAITSIAVTGLLWLGVASGLDAEEPDAAVSLLLAGAALYSGVTAVRGEHVLVTKLFAASRRWLGLVSFAALAASAVLAMQMPSEHPVDLWRLAAIAGSVASLRLLWSAIRAPG